MRSVRKSRTHGSSAWTVGNAFAPASPSASQAW